jgi:diguanylate cyclase (GGDEF)-like protein/PAS domain S-box-containing protein
MNGRGAGSALASGDPSARARNAGSLSLPAITPAEILRALRDHEFRLVYQPQVDTTTCRLVGVEALLRWEHHRLGTLSPSSFLSSISASGLWSQVTSYVIDRAVGDAAGWHASGTPVRVWMNLAASDLARSTSLPETIRSALAARDLPGAALGVELTESGVLRSVDDARGVLEEVKSMGVGIALDDFGTGFSSLTHLRRLPFDAVKIDRSFVNAIDTSPADATITGAVIEVCRSLGVHSVVEGVETVAEWDTVTRLGASQVQGFLLGRPASSEHVPRWFETAWDSLIAERRRAGGSIATVRHRPTEPRAAEPLRARRDPTPVDPAPANLGSGLPDPDLAVWADQVLAPVGDVVAIIAPGGEFRYVSPSIRTLLGQDPHRLTGTNCFALIHGDDVEDLVRSFRHLARAARTNGPVSLPTCRLQHANGSWIEVELTGVNRLDSRGLRGTVVAFRPSSSSDPLDRTRRRLERLAAHLARRALDDSPASFLLDLTEAMRQLTDILDVDVAFADVVSHDDQRLYVLGEWHRGYGAGAATPTAETDGIELRRVDTWLVALASRQVLAFDDMSYVQEPWCAQIDEVFWRGRRPTSLLAIPLVAEGNVVGVLGARTITKARRWNADEIAVIQSIADTVALGILRRRDDRARERSQLQLAALAADADDVLAATDLQGIIRYVSPAIERMLGLDPLAVVGTKLSRLVHPDDLPLANDRLIRVRSGAPVERGPVRLRHVDGRWIWTETSTRLIDQEEFTGVVFVVRDVTRERDEMLARSKARDLELFALRLSQQALRISLPAAIAGLDAMAAELAGLLDVDLVFVDEVEGTHVTCHASFVSDRSATQVMPSYDVRDHLAFARTLERREPLFFDSSDPAAELLDSLGRNENDRAAGAVLPLLAGGRLLGGLNLGSSRPRTWTDNEMTTLRIIADTLASMFDRRRLDVARQRTEGRFRRLADNAADVVTLCDDRGILLYVSPASAELLGRRPDDLVGATIFDLIHPEDLVMVKPQLRALMNGDDMTFEVRLQRGDGSWIWVAHRTRRVSSEEGAVEFWGSLRDISERRRLAAELEHRASHDPLTDLPNRAALAQRVKALREQRELPASLVIVDLDEFKLVNDRFGHLTGDDVLVEVAQRMRAAVRETDLVVRIGGDEFVVLCPATPRDLAERLARRLLDSVRRPMRVGGGGNVTVGCSIGIATAIDDEQVEQLLGWADDAMYEAKATGKGRAVLAGPEPDQRPTIDSSSSR